MGMRTEKKKKTVSQRATRDEKISLGVNVAPETANTSKMHGRAGPNNGLV